MRRLRGGYTTYGQDLGILMLETPFPRPPGDVGNALTWPFPARYRVVSGATSDRIMGTAPDETLLDPFIEAAQQLEREGVKAITTSCGFLAVFHQELQAAVSVPMLTSALLQVPLAWALCAPDRKVGILTERADLTERHFNGVGWSSDAIPVVVRGMPDDAVFPTVFIDQVNLADTETLEREVVELAEGLIADNPEVGAIVLECTNFVPYSRAMRRVAKRPVFDLYTLVAPAMQAIVAR